MSEIDKMVVVPDEMLSSVVGGKLSSESLDFVRTVSMQLKDNGYPFNNAMAWWHEQCAGYRFSNEDWQEIEGAVRSVYEG
ncbi:MAG: hypothetical protein IKG11_03195 [Atopobiaceae bacterium]|nr:hypothetical protein [Atopobiaceae bacterium]